MERHCCGNANCGAAGEASWLVPEDGWHPLGGPDIVLEGGWVSNGGAPFRAKWAVIFSPPFFFVVEFMVKIHKLCIKVDIDVEMLPKV